MEDSVDAALASYSRKAPELEAQFSLILESMLEILALIVLNPVSNCFGDFFRHRHVTGMSLPSWASLYKEWLVHGISRS